MYEPIHQNLYHGPGGGWASSFAWTSFSVDPNNPSSRRICCAIAARPAMSPLSSFTSTPQSVMVTFCDGVPLRDPSLKEEIQLHNYKHMRKSMRQKRLERLADHDARLFFEWWLLCARLATYRSILETRSSPESTRPKITCFWSSLV